MGDRKVRRLNRLFTQDYAGDIASLLLRHFTQLLNKRRNRIRSYVFSRQMRKRSNRATRIPPMRIQVHEFASARVLIARFRVSFSPLICDATNPLSLLDASRIASRRVHRWRLGQAVFGHHRHNVANLAHLYFTTETSVAARFHWPIITTDMGTNSHEREWVFA